MYSPDLDQSLGKTGQLEGVIDRSCPIEIIPEPLCREGISALQRAFAQQFPYPESVSIIPILRDGAVVGEALTSVHRRTANPMRMSYYAANAVRLPRPVCLQEPQINEIVVDGRTRAVAFAEAVIDTQGTIQGAIGHINGQIDAVRAQIGTVVEYLRYYLFVLVSKIHDGIVIPVLTIVPAFQVDHRIWVHGMGCDNNGSGREEPRIMGVLSPFTVGIPQQPYFRKLF